MNDDFKNISPEMFEFVQEETQIKDEEFKGKRIGFYQDAWIRFRRNKVSLVAFILICIILLFTFVGPYLRDYNVPKENPNQALSIAYMPARIPGLEKLGIFDGARTVTITRSYYETLPKEMIKKVKGTRSNSGSDEVIVEVYYYQYFNYQKSYDAGNRDTNGNIIVPTVNLSKAEYEDALERGLVIQLVSTNGVSYTTQVRYLEFVFNQNVEDIYFWFGTEELGRDLFTLIWSGSRVSMLMAITIMLINIVIGVFFGSIAGYYGGKIDLVFDRVVEILSGIPFMGLLSLLVLRFGPTTSIVIVAFTLTGWIGVYGSTRAQTYRYKNREYVLAARTLGASDARIISKHILPNALGTLITSFSLMIPSFIFTESTYSFLGIINYSNATSIGRLISEGQNVMQLYPHALLFPAIYISILMIAFNLFSNGLRDAFNPSLRGVEEWWKIIKY